MEYAVQLITAFTGSVGFSLLFNVRRGKLTLAGLGGVIAWGVYLLSVLLISNDVPRFFLASLALTLYAEIMARVCKAPATVFLVSASIPLIPGGSLYTTMRYAVESQWEAFSAQGTYTLLLAAAIAGGMMCMMALLHAVSKIFVATEHIVRE